MTSGEAGVYGRVDEGCDPRFLGVLGFAERRECRLVRRALRAGTAGVAGLLSIIINDPRSDTGETLQQGGNCPIGRVLCREQTRVFQPFDVALRATKPSKERIHRRKVDMCSRMVSLCRVGNLKELKMAQSGRFGSPSRASCDGIGLSDSVGNY